MLNVKLLRKVKAHILAEPARLRMGQWLIRDEANKTICLIADWGEPIKVRIPNCGTVGCIAGWTCELSKKRYAGPSIASRLLGLKEQQLDSLFMVSSWPEKIQGRYLKAKRQSARAKIVGERIDGFIKEQADRWQGPRIAQLEAARRRR